jgi:hypothetical protein
VNTKKRKRREKRKQKQSEAQKSRRSPQASEPRGTALSLTYDVSERILAIESGGLGVVHTLGETLGLSQALNDSLSLLERHVPYEESDHIEALAYNILVGGTCLQDLERLRQDPGYLQVVGASRLPAPSTAGDFLRRFETEEPLLKLQDAINEVRQKVWKHQPASFRTRAILDVDGTHAPTEGECKQGMGLSHEGIWGYAPLIVSMAGTREVLYIVNRPGNAVSHEGAKVWIDRAIGLTKGIFQEVWLRGDTDFSLTACFDGWQEQGVFFVLGFDAVSTLKEKAQALPEEAWQPLERPPAYEVKTRPRKRPPNVKAQIVRAKGFRNLTLLREEVAEFAYRPTKCAQTYRMIVLRKHLRITKGEQVLEETVRYFFYITNAPRMTPAEVVAFSNGRCDQENHIEQLKNGVNALRCPTRDLLSNGAYMIIATLAWNLKIWMGLLMPNRTLGGQVVRMEFKRFLSEWMRIPCQVLRTGRRVVLRLLRISGNTRVFLDTFRFIQHLRFP